MIQYYNNVFKEIQVYLEYEFEWFVETLVILTSLSLKKNDHGEHFLKYLFIKDLISQQQENKKMVNLENLEIVCLINLD